MADPINPASDDPAPQPGQDGDSDKPPVLEYSALANPKPQTGLVTVGTYGNTFEARLAVGKLEAEGIPCAVLDENVATAGGLLMSALTGGIKVQVPAADVERAMAVLPQRRGARAVRCPACGSPQTVEVPLTPGVKLLFLLMLGLPYLFIDMRWACRACGHVWKRSHLAEEEVEEDDDESDESDDEEEEEDDPVDDPPETGDEEDRGHEDRPGIR